MTDNYEMMLYYNIHQPYRILHTCQKDPERNNQCLIIFLNPNVDKIRPPEL